MSEESKLPPRVKREATGLPPRQPQTTDKTAEQVIKDAPLKTNVSEQTNPIAEELPLEKTKPWMVGQKLSEAELMNVGKMKSFQIPVLLQDKITVLIESRKKQARGIGQKRVTDTSIILEFLEKGLNSELKKLGFDTKINDE